MKNLMVLMRRMKLVAFLLVVVVAVGWVKNLIKLTNCDFEAPYKCEVVHALGLMPPIGAITGWLDVSN